VRPHHRTPETSSPHRVAYRCAAAGSGNRRHWCRHWRRPRRPADIASRGSIRRTRGGARCHRPFDATTDSHRAIAARANQSAPAATMSSHCPRFALRTAAALVHPRDFRSDATPPTTRLHRVLCRAPPQCFGCRNSRCDLTPRCQPSPQCFGCRSNRCDPTPRCRPSHRVGPPVMRTERTRLARRRNEMSRCPCARSLPRVRQRGVSCQPTLHRQVFARHDCAHD